MDRYIDREERGIYRERAKESWGGGGGGGGGGGRSDGQKTTNKQTKNTESGIPDQNEKFLSLYSIQKRETSSGKT